jgi:hypothetical protein
LRIFKASSPFSAVCMCSKRPERFETRSIMYLSGSLSSTIRSETKSPSQVKGIPIISCL